MVQVAVTLDEASSEDAANEERRERDERSGDRDVARAGEREAQEDDVAGHIRDEDVTESQIAYRVNEPSHEREGSQEQWKAVRLCHLTSQTRSVGSAIGNTVYGLGRNVCTRVRAMRNHGQSLAD